VAGYNTNTVTNCYNTGTVSGSQYVGGVVGNNPGTVTNCHNTGNVSGNNYVGGVVCNNYNGSVTNCYNTGDVSGKNYVGGVVGNNFTGSVTNCYNTGTISGNDYVGGVTGYNNDSTVTNCYNTGDVSGNSNVGGVTGQNDTSTVTNCYFDSTVYRGNAVGYNGGTVDSLTGGKTKEQFASGEVAYLLGEAWGQKLEGENRQNYPVLDGEKVYPVQNCKNTVFYFNTEGETGFHRYKNGFCVYCDGFETPEGSGAEESPYLIDNAGKLYWFASQVNNNYIYNNIQGKLTANIVVNHNVLKADGTLYEGTFREWTPIGNYKGIFDGNGKTVSGLYFNNSDTDYVGLFGSVNGGTVQKVGVVDSYFRGNEYVGGVVGYNGYLNKNSTVTDCYSVCSINGTWRVGGVVGYNNGTVENCHNTGNVSGSQYVGDVVGNNTNTVTNCYYLADSETDDIDGTTAKTAAQFASGEVAYLLDSVSSEDDIVWRQNIGTENYPVFSGAMVYPVYNCENTIIFGYSNTEGQVVHNYDDNGFCISCDSFEIPKGSGTEGNPYLIDNAGKLYWFALKVNGGSKSIHGKLTENIVVNQNVLKEDGTLNSGAFREWTPIGNNMVNHYNGIFNGNGKTVSGLYLNNSSAYHVGLFGYVQGGTVQNVGVVDSYFSGDTNVGGVVGNLMTGTVTNCYNTGTVSGSENVGGVVGRNTGTVENCYNTGTVSGNENVGGVVGNNTENVENCYNTGTVSGSEYIGGVVGYNTDTVENCYYLADSETDDIDGTIAKTENQFTSGEVAYLLGKAWGQILEGENRQDYPVLDGTIVYFGYVSCADDAQMVYTNNSNASDTKYAHADANLDGRCDVCKTSIYGISLRGSTLTLNGNIGLNFCFELDETRKDSIWTNETALIRFNLADGRVIDVPVNEGQEDTESVQGTTLYKYTCELYAKQMADVVVAQVIIDEQVIAQYKHSVVNYAKVIIANADGKYSEDAIRLVKAMLNYGANAQINFGYNYDAENPETLANAQLGEAEKSLDAVTVDTLESYKASGMEVDGLGKFAGSNLVLESETTLNVYFEPLTGITLNDLTFTVDGEDIAATQSGKYLVISIKNVKANELDNRFDISVTNGTINGTFQCSVFAYCYSVLNDTEGTFTNELKNTVKALYLYNAAAN